MHIAFTTASSHHQWFMEVVHRYGYLALFGIIAAQDVGVPTLVPAAVLLIFAGYLASTGALNPVVCGLAAAAGSVVGASALFGIARLGGEAFFRRFGRFIHLDQERHARLERALWRWGLPAWLAFRFVPGFRDLLSIIAGFGGMSYAEFALFTSVSALIWAYTFVVVGMLLGPHWHAAARVLIASGPITVAIVVVGVGVLALVWWRRAQRK